MPDSPPILSSRRRAAGNLPGMAPAASAEEPPATPTPPTDAPGRKATADTASAPSGPKRPARRESRHGAADPIGFGGAQKITVSTRTYQALWDAYTDLAAELTREGRGRVFQNDVINAVLAVCLPPDAAAARARLAEYRALLEADPPRDLRTVS
jgi:hypothetical protein